MSREGVLRDRCASKKQSISSRQFLVRFALFTLRPRYFIELFSLSSVSDCNGTTH